MQLGKQSNKSVLEDLKRAVGILEPVYKRDVVRLGLYCQLADAYVDLKKYDFSTVYSIYALKINPLGGLMKKIS
jgi:hypothetical protein